MTGVPVSSRAGTDHIDGNGARRTAPEPRAALPDRARAAGGTPGPRRPHAPPRKPRYESVEVERSQLGIVEAGVVGQLVDHGSTNLFGELVRIREVLLERDPEERDLVRK